MPLAAKARAIEEHLLARHLSPEGVLIYVRACDPLVADSPDAYANLSDCPIWTGALAGAWAFKYAETRDPGDREVLARILDGIALLHDVTGKPGLLARAVFPRRHPVPGRDADGEWRDAPPPLDGWSYRGDVSRDQYFGVLFGFAAVCAELGIDSRSGDGDLRRRMAAVALPVADHFWENGGRIIDADGEMTTHGDLRPSFLGVPLGPNAGLMLGFQLLAWRLSGEERFRSRYDELWELDYAGALRLVHFETFGWLNLNNDNMGAMALYALTQLEEDAARLAVYDRHLERLWLCVRHHGNAFWDLIYARRRALPRGPAFDLRENLKLYPLDLEVRGFDHRGLPGVERACFDDRFGRPENRTALPMHLRERGDFVWKLSPFALVVDAPPGPPRCGSGCDFLLAYWMARRWAGDPETWRLR